MKSIVTTKCKAERRLGSLWGRPKSPVAKRAYGPGQHGQDHGKPTDYAIQLRAKQRLKEYYGNISEKQLVKYYKEAIRRKGDTSENLIGILESRLDALVYRMKLVPTVFAARQFVNHGHITVNGKRVDIPSYLVKVGDVIAVRNKSKEIPMVIEAMASQERTVPDYITVDEKNMSGSLTRVPLLADVPYACQMEPNVVVEFYSK